MFSTLCEGLSIDYDWEVPHREKGALGVIWKIKKVL